MKSKDFYINIENKGREHSKYPMDKKKKKKIGPLFFSTTREKFLGPTSGTLPFFYLQ